MKIKLFLVLSLSIVSTSCGSSNNTPKTLPSPVFAEAKAIKPDVIKKGVISEQTKAEDFVASYLNEVITEGDLPPRYFCEPETKFKFRPTPTNFNFLRVKTTDKNFVVIARVIVNTTSTNFNFLINRKKSPLSPKSLERVGEYNMCLDFIAETTP
jgi:hypothetical protein